MRPTYPLATGILFLTQLGPGSLLLITGRADSGNIYFRPRYIISISAMLSIRRVSGLGDFGPPSLGAFIAEVTFDGNILSAHTPSFGAFLGDPSDLLETDIVTIRPAVVSLDEFSFLSNSDLDALQPESFSLATLSFTGDSFGTSAQGFGLIDLTDATGSRIIDPSIEAATVSVVQGTTDGPSPIPLPASFWFLATALFSLFGIGKLKTP